MIKLNRCLLLICFFVIGLGAEAQIFSVAEGTEFSIKAGTILAAERLEINPSIDYIFSNNSLSVDETPSFSNELKFVKRSYKFTSIINGYTGRMKFSYLDNELTAWTRESGIKFLYNNGSNWIQENATVFSSFEKYVQNNALTDISIKELSAGGLIGTLKITNSIKATPNPSYANFNVEVLTEVNKEIDLMVTDVQGKILKSYKVKPFEKIIFGTELASGTYFVIARQGGLVTSTRIVKL